jgi:hypothetical protein
MFAAQKSKFIFLGVLEELHNHSKNRASCGRLKAPLLLFFLSSCFFLFFIFNFLSFQKGSLRLVAIADVTPDLAGSLVQGLFKPREPCAGYLCVVSEFASRDSREERWDSTGRVE